jgi:preprotein translocase subunit SecD
MRQFPLIVLTAFMCGAAPATAAEIALSLVHGQSRIDIPTSAVTRIEPRATITFVITETKQPRDFPSPHVELCYTAEIQAQICRLTRQIIDQPMSIVVDCERVSRPVVLEPICGSCVQISADDILEANALAQRLKKGSNRRCAPLS